MAQTYLQLQAQIAQLQTEAETIRKVEFAEVVSKIRVAIDAYGITVQDLFGDGATKSPAANVKSAAGASSKSRSPSINAKATKFTDGNGNTWGGRGPRPRWLREALAGGKSLSAFAVETKTRPTEGTAAGSKPATTHAVANRKPAKKRLPAKYKDASGNSWTGRGSQPRWLRAAIAAGNTAEQFLV